MGCGASTSSAASLKPTIIKRRGSVNGVDLETFVEDHWLPFAKELRDELRYVEARCAAGFSESERLPPQERFVEWGHRCVELTEQWRGSGKGSLSLVYQALVRMGQYDGVAPYQFDQVPTRWSEDGFVRVLDAVKRRNFYVKPKPTIEKSKEEDIERKTSGSKGKGKGNGKGKGKKAAPAPAPTAPRKVQSYSAINEHGDLIQNVGESAIANTEISGVMTTRDSRLLGLGALCRAFTLRVVRRRQLKVLSNMHASATTVKARNLLDRLIESATDADGCAVPADAKSGRSLFKKVASVFEDVQETKKTAKEPLSWKLARAVLKARVDVDSAAWTALLAQGQVCGSYKQLEAKTKMKCTQAVEIFVDEGLTPEEEDDELGEFVNFCRNHPGGVWMEDGSLHRQKLVEVQLSPAFVVVNKKAIQAHTKHRFVPVRWKRTVPLLEGQEFGPPKIIRKVGQVECSRLRSNAFTYDDQHGLGLCSDTNPTPNALDLRSGGRRRPKVTLEDEGGGIVSTKVSDPGAKVGNWFMADVEKVIYDFVTLTPQNGRAYSYEGYGSRLPGEMPVVVGQNPRVASSIGATQHTQIASGDAGRWPIFSLRSHPNQSHELYELADDVQCYIELVQVGEDPDAIMLRVECPELKHAMHPEVVGLIHDARNDMLLRFGGRAIDFNVYATSVDCESGAVIILTPLAMIGANDDRSVWSNPDTGMTAVDYNLPCHSVDFSQGKGNIHALSDAHWEIALEGRDMMGRLYDFVRKVGAREAMDEFLHDNLPGWKESTPFHAEIPAGAPASRWVNDSFWDEDKAAYAAGGKASYVVGDEDATSLLQGDNGGDRE